MPVVEPVEARYHYLEYELNRLSGTLVNDMPTLGAATSALWWWGHREKNWALYNLLTPNQATGGSALKTTDGFVGRGDAKVSLVETNTIVGEESVQIKAPMFPELEDLAESSTRAKIHPNVPVLYLELEPRIDVLPMHIYTAAALVKAEQKTHRGTSFIFDWYDETGEPIDATQGGSWSSKFDEWTQMWVTAPAPENAASVQIKVRWEFVTANEAFTTDKWIFHNSSDVEAWAYPGCGSVDLQAGLKAHLNMVAGIYNSDEFMDFHDICNHLGGVAEASPADALSLIPHEARNVIH